MFTKVNVKQEQFLWLVVEGMPAMRAYAEVYAPAMGLQVAAANASRMLKKANVQARKAEIMAARAARQPITADFLTTELIATALESRALGQGSAAQACYMGVAKIHGLIVDKVQSDVLVRKPSGSPESPDDMSADDWLGKHVLTLTPINTTENKNADDDVNHKA